MEYRENRFICFHRGPRHYTYDRREALPNYSRNTRDRDFIHARSYEIEIPSPVAASTPCDDQSKTKGQIQSLDIFLRCRVHFAWNLALDQVSGARAKRGHNAPVTYRHDRKLFATANSRGATVGSAHCINFGKPNGVTAANSPCGIGGEDAPDHR